MIFFMLGSQRAEKGEEMEAVCVVQENMTTGFSDYFKCRLVAKHLKFDKMIVNMQQL